MVEIESRTTPNPTSVEMLRPVDPGVWLGMLCTEEGHQVAITCGDDCLVTLFTQMFEIDDTKAAEGEDASLDSSKADTQPAPPEAE
jgi:hypothetical protein